MMFRLLGEKISLNDEMERMVQNESIDELRMFVNGGES